MGEVWSARNERTNHDFAIKFLSRGLATSREALERFVQEARVLGRPGMTRERFESILAKQMPDLPEQGDLDLGTIMQARYMFA